LVGPLRVMLICKTDVWCGYLWNRFKHFDANSQGFREACLKGALTGHKVEGIHIRLKDGEYLYV